MTLTKIKEDALELCIEQRDLLWKIVPSEYLQELICKMDKAIEAILGAE